MTKVFFILFFFLAFEAQAGGIFQYTVGGTPSGTFTAEKPYPFRAITSDVRYVRFSKPSFGVGVAFHFDQSDYITLSSHKQGYNNVVGLALQSTIQKKYVQVHLISELFPFHSLSMGGISATVVNDKSIKQAAVSTYTGNIGGLLGMNVFFVYTKWPVSKKAPLLIGTGFSFRAQAFSQVRTVSYDSRGKSQDVAKEVDYTLTYPSLHGCLALSF